MSRSYRQLKNQIVDLKNILDAKNGKIAVLMIANEKLEANIDYLEKEIVDSATTSEKEVVEPSTTFSSRFMPNVKFKFISHFKEVRKILIEVFPPDCHHMIPSIERDCFFLCTNSAGKIVEPYSDIMDTKFNLKEVSIYEAIPELVPDGMVYDKESDSIVRVIKIDLTKPAEEFKLPEHKIVCGFNNNWDAPSLDDDFDGFTINPTVDKKEVVEPATTSDEDLINSIHNNGMSFKDINSLFNAAKTCSTKEWCEENIDFPSYDKELKKHQAKWLKLMSKGEREEWNKNTHYVSGTAVMFKGEKLYAFEDGVEPTRFMPNVKFKVSDIQAISKPLWHLPYFVAANIVAFPYFITSEKGSTIFCIDEQIYNDSTCDEFSVFEVVPQLVPDGMVYDKKSDSLVLQELYQSRDVCADHFQHALEKEVVEPSTTSDLIPTAFKEAILLLVAEYGFSFDVVFYIVCEFGADEVEDILTVCSNHNINPMSLKKS